MVGIQHANEMKEIIKQIIYMTQENDRRQYERKTLHSPHCIPPSEDGPTYLDRHLIESHLKLQLQLPEDMS
jgi:hypothetical protein